MLHNFYYKERAWEKLREQLLQGFGYTRDILRSSWFSFPGHTPEQAATPPRVPGVGLGRISGCLETKRAGVERGVTTGDDPRNNINMMTHLGMRTMELRFDDRERPHLYKVCLRTNHILLLSLRLWP
jgi:hypothetical protein